MPKQTKRRAGPKPPTTRKATAAAHRGRVVRATRAQQLLETMLGKGFVIEGIANGVGVSMPTVRRWVKGTAPIPKALDALEAFAATATTKLVRRVRRPR